MTDLASSDYFSEMSSQEALSSVSTSTRPIRRYAGVVKLLAKFKVQQAVRAEKEYADLKRLQSCMVDTKKELGFRCSADESCDLQLDHQGLGLNLVALTRLALLQNAKSEHEERKSVFWPHVEEVLQNAPKVFRTESGTRKNVYRLRPPDHALRRQQSMDEIVPWLNERIQVSSRPVQFVLPFDVRTLQNLTVGTYLAKYCKIPHERMIVFTRVFKKFKHKDTNLITADTLVPAIMALLYDCVSTAEVDHFLYKLRLRKIDLTFDLQSFARIAALAERILYLSYAEAAGSVPLGVLKTFRESADFSALDWKLDGLKIDPHLRKLLASL